MQFAIKICREIAQTTSAAATSTTAAVQKFSDKPCFASVKRSFLVDWK